MAIIKRKELGQMGEDELKSKLADLRKELMKHNTEIARGTAIKNPGIVKETKKTIARILTIFNQKKNETKEKTAKKEDKKPKGGKSEKK